MLDLKAVGVDIFTLGQYLQPTPNHLAVSLSRPRWALRTMHASRHAGVHVRAAV
jgi:lipoate synthase